MQHTFSVNALSLQNLQQQLPRSDADPAASEFVSLVLYTRKQINNIV